MLNNKRDTFLQLVRLGIGNQDFNLCLSTSEYVDWSEVKVLAERQGLSAVVLDGIEALRSFGQSGVALPEKRMLTQWIGEVLQGYEYRYELYSTTIGEMAEFYSRYGFKMMVLKGYACSLDWPKPEHRPTGDIDIWQFGRQREADDVLAAKKGVSIDNSHHHHTLFPWNDFMVENHYDFVNVHTHKSSAELEKILKELGRDDSHIITVHGEKVYLPSPNLHALFLIRHMASHFVGANITFRQVLDWAFFIKNHGKDVDWNWLNGIVAKYHMKDFMDCINAICVEDLGFDASLFNCVQYDSVTKEKVLNDIFEPAFESSEPKQLIRRLIYKYRRWRGNSWKHNLCYDDSLWSAFWYGIWAKIQKPATI